MRRKLMLSLLVAAGALPCLVGFVPTRAGHWTLIGWNNLGMHCDDSDFSVFSILPPFNVVNAQLIDDTGALIGDSTGFTVTYEAVADPTGSINRSSIGKTNYWSFSKSLYGASSVPDTGLAGFNMPGPANTPQPMAFDSNASMFHADGIPITPYDDAMHKRTYPLMKLVARDAAGNVLATTTPVLPVSDEMDCAACHGSTSADDAMPDEGWVFDRNEIRDYRLNILRLHDDRFLGNARFIAALATAGYSPNGLEATVRTMNTPILCARCHASNALPGTGIAGIPQLTTSIHSFHGHVTDPLTGLSLDDSTNRQSCYRCHPGSSTKCLRGVMGASVAADGSLAIQCQNCHGPISAVGDSSRTGWLDQPNCQACHTGTATHNNGQIRYTDVFESDGSMRVAVDTTFATNVDTPDTGFSLYRFSSGHGGLQCEACHGSTHAEFPAAHPNDNLQSTQIEGHVGVLAECTACHAATPSTDNGGPHGMHPVGQSWVSRHQGARNRLGLAACQACHGSDNRGTVLSRASADRSLDVDDLGTINIFRGQVIGCYTCHDGPNDDGSTSNTAPTATDNSTTAVDQPVDVVLGATDADGDALVLRIVEQPHFGRVALNGTTSTYIPDPGFAGVDTYTFAAWDGSIDSNLATVTVTRGATWDNFGTGYPGTGAAIPTLSLDTNPQLGAHVKLSLGNTGGATTLALLVISPEQAALTTRFGGLLMTELSSSVVTVVPAGGATIAGDVPGDPAFIGQSEFLQSLQIDPGAPFHVAFSYGLRMTIGQ